MKHLAVQKPDPTEYAPYYAGYISLVDGDCIVSVLTNQMEKTQEILSGIPEETGTYRYTTGKWSVKEVIGHVIDTERIMAYRALRIARNDQTPIEGFEQDDYIENAAFDDCSISQLAAELLLIRKANISMFENFEKEAWDRLGTASDTSISVKALAYIIAGHELHHFKILNERYLG